jgi:N-acetylmuramate 1-kinase
MERSKDKFLQIQCSIIRGMTVSPSDARFEAVRAWLASLKDLRFDLNTLAPASDDASFRRYFRVNEASHGTVIVMDAPPPQEDVRPFVAVAQLFAATGISVPTILAQEPTQGFLVLSDFGNTTYLSVLTPESASALYGQATTALVRLQAGSKPGVLPAYDEALLRRELALFPDWYLAKHKQRTLTDKEQQVLQNAFNLIVQANLSEAQVFVHRDYHSRNLMVLPGGANPGIIDFQDAVYGPISYDLVSLLRDAYVMWPEASVIDAAIRYWETARKAKLPVPKDFSAFYRDFEWMGLQRHIKVLGIFARLNYRDGKERYLADMPLVLHYVLTTARRYNALGPFVKLLEQIEGQNAKTGYTF